MATKQLMTADEAAAILGLHPQTLWRWRRDGIGPSFTQVGRKIRYQPEQIDEWLDAQRRTPEKAESLPTVSQPPAVEDEEATDREALALADAGDFEDWNAVKTRNGL